eukprot:1148344-Pelagomonas_calceolata.AAC.3
MPGAGQDAAWKPQIEFCQNSSHKYPGLHSSKSPPDASAGANTKRKVVVGCRWLLEAAGFELIRFLPQGSQSVLDVWRHHQLCLQKPCPHKQEVLILIIQS